MGMMPKRCKFRKRQRGRRRGVATRGTELSFGQYGLKALDRAWLTGQQIEAARVALTRHVKRGGKLWIRVFPDHPASKKPAEVRMGKGKGEPDKYVVVIKPGRVLFEMDGVPETLAKSAMRLCAFKLPFPTKFVKREAV